MRACVYVAMGECSMCGMWLRFGNVAQNENTAKTWLFCSGLSELQHHNPAMFTEAPQLQYLN